MTPSQLPGYLGREIPEGLPLLFTSTVFSLSLFLSLALKRRFFVTTPLKTWLLGLIMIKVTADRALRENINHIYSDILMFFEANYRIPAHLTFLSLQCIQMSCLTMIQIEDQITLGNGSYTFTQAWKTESCTTGTKKQKQRYMYSICLGLLNCFNIYCPFVLDGDFLS